MESLTEMFCSSFHVHKKSVPVQKHMSTIETLSLNFIIHFCCLQNDSNMIVRSIKVIPEPCDSFMIYCIFNDIIETRNERSNLMIKVALLPAAPLEVRHFYSSVMMINIRLCGLLLHLSKGYHISEFNVI